MKYHPRSNHQHIHVLTLEHLVDILIEVVNSQGIIDEIFTFPYGHAIPSQVDWNFASCVFQGYKLQQPPYTPGYHTNPRGFGLGPRRVHVLGEASNGIIAGDAGISLGLADEAGSVMGQTQKVSGALQELLLCLGELRELGHRTGALFVRLLDLGSQGSRVVSIHKDGVCKPAQHEVQEAFRGSPVLRPPWGQGLCPV